jgi:ABC-type phosphate transport system permease subunit
MILGTFGAVIGASLGAGAGVYLATYEPWSGGTTEVTP